MSMLHTVSTIGRALDPNSKERYGRVGEVRLTVRDVQALLNDWKRLDKEVRELNELMKAK
jgi:hypothetical protein